MADDLEELPGVGPATADSLKDAGYNSFDKIATTAVSKLEDEAGVGESTAQDVVQAARDAADIGGFQSSAELMEERKNVGVLRTLIPEVDDMLNAEGEDSNQGGVKTQAITEVYGEYGSGKSQFTHQMCVNVQLPEEYGGLSGRAIFIDTEDSFRPERIREMVRGLDEEIIDACMERDIGGGDPNDEDDLAELEAVFNGRIQVAKSHSVGHQMLLMEEAGNIASEFEDSDFPVRLVCVDSLTSQFRAEYVGRGSLAERQQKLNTHIHDIRQFVNVHNAAAIVANQVQSNPDSFFGDPTKPVGGNILGHNSNYRIYIKNSKGNKRVFNLVNSPNLPEGEAVARIETEGLKPE